MPFTIIHLLLVYLGYTLYLSTNQWSKDSHAREFPPFHAKSPMLPPAPPPSLARWPHPAPRPARCCGCSASRAAPQRRRTNRGSGTADATPAAVFFGGKTWENPPKMVSCPWKNREKLWKMMIFHDIIIKNGGFVWLINYIYIYVYVCRGVQTMWVPQIIHLNGTFHETIQKIRWRLFQGHNLRAWQGLGVLEYICAGILISLQLKLWTITRTIIITITRNIS